MIKCLIYIASFTINSFYTHITVETLSVCGPCCYRYLFIPPLLIGGELSDDAVWRLCVCLSVAYIGTKSRTERHRKTKIGTEVAHVTRDSDTTFKFKRSKVKVTRPLYSPRRLRIRWLQRWPWERIHRGAVGSAARGASAPTEGAEWGILWRLPHSLLGEHLIRGTALDWCMRRKLPSWTKNVTNRIKPTWINLRLENCTGRHSPKKNIVIHITHCLLLPLYII